MQYFPNHQPDFFLLQGKALMRSSHLELQHKRFLNDLMIDLDLSGRVHKKQVKMKNILLFFVLFLFFEFSTPIQNIEFHIHQSHMEIGLSELIKFYTRKMDTRSCKICWFCGILYLVNQIIRKISLQMPSMCYICPTHWLYLNQIVFNVFNFLFSRFWLASNFILESYVFLFFNRR